MLSDRYQNDIDKFKAQPRLHLLVDWGSVLWVLVEQAKPRLELSQPHLVIERFVKSDKAEHDALWDHENKGNLCDDQLGHSFDSLRLNIFKVKRIINLLICKLKRDKTTCKICSPDNGENSDVKHVLLQEVFDHHVIGRSIFHEGHVCWQSNA